MNENQTLLFSVKSNKDDVYQEVNGIRPMKRVEIMGQFLGPDRLNLVQIRRYLPNQISIDKSPGSQRGGLELIIHY